MKLNSKNEHGEERERQVDLCPGEGPDPRRQLQKDELVSAICPPMTTPSSGRSVATGKKNRLQAVDERPPE